MSAPITSPHGSSWALVVNALAELGAKEIERRAKAQQADENARRDEATQAQPNNQAAESDQA